MVFGLGALVGTVVDLFAGDQKAKNARNAAKAQAAAASAALRASQQRADAQRVADEAKAKRMKMIMLGVGGVALVGAVVVLKKR